MGTSLSRKKEDEWVAELRKLESIPERKILKTLKISYDSLEDKDDQSLFLDIACFFVGIDEYYAIKILENRYHSKEKEYPLVKIRIQNLIDHCLLTIDHHMVLTMHRLIQDMGRKIVQEESPEAGERSRLWHHQEVFDVLEDRTGTEAVEGLTLDMHRLKEAGNHGKKCIYEEFRDKSILLIFASSLKRRFLNFNYGQSVSTTITSQNDVYLKTDAFKSMIKLRLLVLNYVQLEGLVWLSWHGFPLKSIPVEFHLKKLVALDLSLSRLEQVWTETPFLGSLKILDLSYSERLARTPNFLGLPNLERLILKGCVSLVEVCESIGNLEMLDLQDCITLRKLPRNIGKLGSLKTLIISGCNIGELPSEMRNMQSLKVLKADGIFTNLLRINSGEVKWWEWIIWPMVAKPRKGPETLSASLPCSLKELRLARCNLSDESFPKNFVNLPSLRYLDLSYNPFRRLPNLIRSLSFKGSGLDIRECHRLRLLDFNGLSVAAIQIAAEGCRSLEIVMPLNGSIEVGPSKGYELVELQESFKKEDITELLSLDVRCKNIQGTYEYGGFSIFLSGNEIPTFTGEKFEGSSSICFTVPLVPTRRIKCLNAWCKWLDDDENYATHFSVKIENKTKDLTWIEQYTYDGCGDYVGLLSPWRLGNQLEAGDEIIITFDYNAYLLEKEEEEEEEEEEEDEKGGYVVKECGYKIVYYDPEEEEEEEEEEKEEEKGSTSTIEESHHHLPTLSRGRNFLFYAGKNYTTQLFFGEALRALLN